MTLHPGPIPAALRPRTPARGRTPGLAVAVGESADFSRFEGHGPAPRTAAGGPAIADWAGPDPTEPYISAPPVPCYSAPAKGGGRPGLSAERIANDNR